MSRCPSIMGRVFGHKLRPVVVSVPSRAAQECRLAANRMLMEIRYPDTEVVGHECERCGEYIPSKHNEDTKGFNPLEQAALPSSSRSLFDDLDRLIDGLRRLPKDHP